MTKRTDIDTENIVIRMWGDGFSARQIEKEMLLGQTTVFRILKRHNIDTSRRKKFDENDIIYDYVNGMSSVKIEHKYNIGNATVFRVLKKHNIETREWAKPVNIDFFSQQTALTAYWMGFSYADCSIADDGKYSLEINKKDEKHLQNLSNVLNIPIQYRSSRPMCKIEFRNKLIPSLMKQWGIVRNKTYNYVAPTFPNTLVIPYILGLIDGDGCIKTNNKKIACGIDIVNNMGTLYWIQNKLRELEIDSSVYDRNKVWGTMAIKASNNSLNNFLKMSKEHESIIMARKVPRLFYRIE